MNIKKTVGELDIDLKVYLIGIVITLIIYILIIYFMSTSINNKTEDLIKETNNIIVIHTSNKVKDYVLNEFKQAGLDQYKAYDIIQCESRWDTQALHVNSNGTVDLGLFQINQIHKDISNQDKLDYKKATAWAINKVKKEGWSAWSCNNKI